MLDVGLPEMLVIMVVVLVVFGPSKLPEVGRGIGRAIGEFRRFTSGAGLLDALEERPTHPNPAATIQRCVTCGAANPLTSRFCGSCGRDLASETEPSRPV